LNELSRGLGLSFVRPLSRLFPLVLLFPIAAATADLPREASDALTADFAERDLLPESSVPESEWYKPGSQESWGPRSAHYPPILVPAGADAIEWKRARIVAVARHYLGLPYQHHHIPAWAPPGQGTAGEARTAGLDCSNFTSWVYNYGLGIEFSSDVHMQADGPKAPGRRLAASEALAPGDLLFVMNRDRTKLTHVVIYIDPGHIIDDHADGVRVRAFSGWYMNSFSHARRIIE
jgi:cell wall-associated NlpC family hydrolase